ncbi:heavy-metal-associated domain-containing protein [Arthrobacter sp. MDB2-24]|jgi:copper chaperone|uniref:Heavy-metal-associated domain-containing protein n=1 Tax=Arthrobacter burdickii TaxID=3035920 RepID=A0ABT8K0X1_9MICC|nr:heavy-metal-associated domain-containing protein [Arthrobacter burdickii]MDN4610004.1 heavy-metal-associated domain-containing protein [Arthrobacter burdickii]
MSTTTISITGMTCGHCVSAVKNELSELPGVENVDVDLVNGGTSTATISSSAPLDAASIDEAVAEAGYSVVPAGS